MKNIRLNPMHWRVTSQTIEGETITHEPMEVSDAAAAKLLQLRRNGVALVVEVEDEAPPEPIFVDKTKPKPKPRTTDKAVEQGDDPA